ncbi:MAG: hypothetical protein IJ566_06905 [Cardiobacteriaceae bacterium]|nr:hypothetical protein [Cardiobacteriaceae bacterium]
MQAINEPISINLTPDENPAGDLILDDEKHNLKVEISKPPINDYAVLSFSSRETLYDFALLLLWHSLYSESLGNMCYSREILHCDYVLDGMRISKDSARLFIYANDKLQY